MDYILGSLYILKNKITKINFFKNVPRIEPSMPWYYQYSYFYSEPTIIINNLYLGSSFNAYSHIANFNVIINVTVEIDNFYENEGSSIKYYKFPIHDNNEDDISPILDSTYNIIDKHIMNSDKILVHCYMGASRSATIIINYLMRKYDWTYDRAKSFVLDKRPLVNLSQKFDMTLKSLDYKNIENNPDYYESL